MQYKDISKYYKDGKFLKWKRWDLVQVKVWEERARVSESVDVFTTIQTFLQPEKPGANDSPEEFECDFYIDFDGDNALEEARRTISYFNNAGVEHIGIWFTGGRGFHLVVPSQVFGGQSSPYLHKLWLLVAKDIKKELGLETLDETIYSKRRMWRVENTLHRKSGLYKIPLTVEEILTLSAEEIKGLAISPRQVEATAEKPERILACSTLYEKAEKIYESWQRDEAWEPSEIVFDEAPPCVEAVLKHGAFALGQVNMIAFRLSSFHKTQGVLVNDAVSLMQEWVLNVKPEYASDFTPEGNVDYEGLQQQVEYTTRSVYANQHYGFSCGGIKQIPGVADFCTVECQESITEETEVDLYNAYDIQYLGKRIRVVAEAIGGREDMCAIPESITVECKTPISGGKYCSNCPLYTTNTLSVSLNSRHRNILNFLEPCNLPLTSRVGTVFGLPDRRSCHTWRYELKERNVEVIYIAPRVSNNFETAERYTRKPVYYLGFGLEFNRGYAFSGYSHIDRKTNVIKLVFDKAEPLADTLSEFEITEEMKEQAKVFMPRSNSIAEKHNDIAGALNYNYVRVWGREAMIQAIDLVYHSPNILLFQRELIRGWLNILIIGDTRQGKSKAAEALMRHYDLGVKVSGETSGRTGLLYTIPVKEKEPAYIVWGTLPRHDRRLVFIDELKELIKTGGFAELTEARSAGIVSVDKTVTGRAFARTRLVMMTNTVGRKTLSSYGYGVAAVLDLIPDREDIGRFDFMIGVASNEIDDGVVNVNIESLEEVADKYSSDVCHDHILWVWSLKPEDILIDPNVENLVLEKAFEMCGDYVAKVPLVEPGDFRHKLVRVAAAAAARMNFRYKDKLYIAAEAVEYAVEFIRGLYSNPVLDYTGYSEAYAAYVLEGEQMEELIKTFLNQFGQSSVITNYLLFNTYTKARELIAVSGMPDNQVRECLYWLSGHKLLESTSQGSFIKTEIGAQFFKALKAVEEKEGDGELV